MYTNIVLQIFLPLLLEKCLANEESVFSTYGWQCLNNTGNTHCQEVGITCNSSSKCAYLNGSYCCVPVHSPAPNTCDCHHSGRPCHPRAQCVWKSKSFQCQCEAGYSGDGYHCTDVDECRTDRHVCHGNQRCVNTAGSYHCVAGE